ncbi:stress protein [Candidatus Nitrosoglobus terrae]|uniref:Stress protein n=2 Tax=Candidatus Nitrosoglobus terrae TaxID=1630141 RepID=A0A1Q2SK06_9GAMM|nr:stress protein [Candidatus Nitrosoglobus terrae]
MNNSHQSLKDILESLTLRIVCNNNILAQYQHQLIDNIENEAALILGEIYRHEQGLKFRAVSQGFVGGQRALAEHFGAEIKEGDLKENEIALQELQEKLARQFPQEVIDEQRIVIREKFEAQLPIIKRAFEENWNGASTRRILNRLLEDALGYRIEETPDEPQINNNKNGRERADYILSVGEGDAIVIEAKRINSKLQGNEEAQIITYRIQSEIKWVLLTNVISWKLYEITTTDNKKVARLFLAVLISLGNRYLLVPISLKDS